MAPCQSLCKHQEEWAILRELTILTLPLYAVVRIFCLLPPYSHSPTHWSSSQLNVTHDALRDTIFSLNEETPTAIPKMYKCALKYEGKKMLSSCTVLNELTEYIMTPSLAKIGKDKWHRGNIKRIVLLLNNLMLNKKAKDQLRKCEEFYQVGTAYSQTLNVSLSGRDVLRSFPNPEPGLWLEAVELLPPEEATGPWRLPSISVKNWFSNGEKKLTPRWKQREEIKTAVY